MRAALVLPIVGALFAAGCASPLLPGETGPRDVQGPTDGYEPTSSFLKVFVKTSDAKSTLVDFDRRDWYVSKIVEKLDQRALTFVAVHGQERQTMGEILVVEALQPTDLNGLRYDHMKSTAQERSIMDAEYDRILEKLVPTSPSVPADLPTVQ